jgi:hypothetical protein
LLSIFLYYRRGYSQGSQWRQQHRLESIEITPLGERDF